MGRPGRHQRPASGGNDPPGRAAPELATGRVTDACTERHRHQEFLGFLKQATTPYPTHAKAYTNYDGAGLVRTPDRDGSSLTIQDHPVC